jgi:hypothetical protein
VLARLPDEQEFGGTFVTFKAGDPGDMEIAAPNTSEGLSVEVLEAGTAKVPIAIFSHMANGLRFYRKRRLEFSFSIGEMRVESMEFRDQRIAVESDDPIKNV